MNNYTFFYHDTETASLGERDLGISKDAARHLDNLLRSTNPDKPWAWYGKLCAEKASLDERVRQCACEENELRAAPSEKVAVYNKLDMVVLFGMTKTADDMLAELKKDFEESIWRRDLCKEILSAIDRLKLNPANLSID